MKKAAVALFVLVLMAVAVPAFADGGAECPACGVNLPDKARGMIVWGHDKPVFALATEEAM